MIQILGLRPYTNPKTGKTDKRTEILGSLWQVASHQEMIARLPEILASHPKNEHYNLYFTLLNCAQNAKPRTWESQKVIGFDIDSIFDETLAPKIIQVFCETLAVDPSKTLTIWSGNGLQFVIELEAAFTDINYFNEKRDAYRVLLDKLAASLKAAKLPGEVDPSVWSAARIFRLPDTENRKPDKGVKRAYLIQPHLEAQKFSLDDVEVKKEDSGELSKEFFQKNWRADNKAILSGCEFMKHAQGSPGELNEPGWYAMLSIAGRMENGEQLVHELSKGHPGYSATETDEKLKQALETAGPRTCKDINFRWGKCKDCPNYGKVKSPILLKGPDHIATEHTGFFLSINGKLVPQYHDLVKYFDKLHTHRTLTDNGLVYVWTGTHFKIWSKTKIKMFAQEHFFPKPNDKMREEFAKFLSSTNPVEREFFSEEINGFLNCKNGVLNLHTKELLPHTPDRGFMYCLPYDYDGAATAPRFDKFLDEVTGGDKTKRAVLEEFGGYAISGDEYWLQKTLLLVGEGANGKSVMIDILKAVAGSDNYATVSLQDLKSENNRQLLEGKLFNASPELSRHALKESEKFKYLSDGSEITVKLMWNQPYKIRNRAKMIFACNDLPSSDDASFGFLRRFAIIHFNQVFVKEKQDKFLMRKLRKELPGILNMFLDGYARLLRQEDFTFSQSMEEEKELYASENNPVAQWLEAWKGKVKVHDLESGGGIHFAPTLDLKKEFDQWATDNGMERIYSVMTLEWFGRMLASSVPEGRRRKIRKMLNGMRSSGFMGIELIYDA